MTLSKIQNGFKEHIAGRRNRDKIDPEFKSLFCNDSIPAEERLAIYKNNLNVSLQRVLISRHRLLDALVGAEFLQALVREYVKNNLPDHGNLNDYGYDFPTFIDKFEHTRGLPYLGDMARLECAWWRSYYAADATPLDPATLTYIPDNQTNRLRFTLHPGTRLIRSDYPVYSIRKMCLEELGEPDDEIISKPSSPNAAADPDAKKDIRIHENNREKTTLNIDSGGECVITCRPRLKTHCVSVGEAEMKFLVYLRAGHTLGEATGKVMAGFPDFNLARTLQKQLKRGIFVSYEIS